MNASVILFAVLICSSVGAIAIATSISLIRSQKERQMLEAENLRDPNVNQK